ncbi:MAG: hypothetical protein R3F20_05040 [Planctomycetota bacterium]
MDSGWLGGSEVVRVEYDPTVIGYEKLLTEAKRRKAACRVFAGNDEELAVARKVFDGEAGLVKGKVRVVKDTRYYARRTALRHIPMTRGQLTRANAFLATHPLTKIEEAKVLSPGQLALLARVQKESKRAWPVLFELDPDIAGWRLDRFLAGDTED